MKAKFLKPGAIVNVGGRMMTFLRRERQIGRQALNWFQCDAYRGLNGPDDVGLCHMTDRYFAKNAQPT